MKTLKKKIDTELFSVLSKSQFDMFFSGCIDGDGFMNSDSYGFCNYNGDIPSIQELLLWNGIYSTSHSNKTRLNISKYENFRPSVSIEYKKNTAPNLEKSNVTKSKSIKYRNLDNGDICVKLTSIEEGGEEPMYDIETSTNYFYTNGIKTHNCNGFDVPYLINRITKVLGQEAAFRLSPICLIRKDEKRGTITIAGVSVLDYLDLYKKFTVGVVRLPNYRLDTVAEHELKEKKIKYEGSLGNLLKTDIKKFIEYNIRDVYLVIGIDTKNKFIELAMALAHVGHIRYEDFSVSSRLLEGALLTYLRRHDLVAPNKPKPEDQIASTYEKEDDGGDVSEEDEDDDIEDKKSNIIVDEDEGFEGAYVKEPVPGRYDWIFSCDINSLYPSTIMSLNISPETLVGQISKWKAKDYASGVFESVKVKIFEENEEKGMNKEEFLDFIKQKNYSISANGALYRQDFDGLLKSILSKWYSERVEYKKKAKEASDNKDSKTESYYNMRQMVQKILLNSLYGVLGLAQFRFYNLINAEAVTISGQNIIKTTADFVNNIYNKKVNTVGVDYVTYVDTDSCAGSSLFHCNGKIDTIENIFNSLWEDDSAHKIEDICGRRYVLKKGLTSQYFDPNKNSVLTGNVKYIEAHRVKKKMYRIKSKNGKFVEVTEDHSVMILENGCLVEKKPTEIKKGDKIISL